MRKLSALLLVGITALAGCATASKMNRVAVGMTKAEVLSSIGEPNRTSSLGRGVEVLHYRLNARGGPIVNLIRDDYVVKLTNGRVASYGKVDGFVNDVEY